MYDEISSQYDHFVNWKNRLEFEMPFLERQLEGVLTGSRPLRILDAACGTAMHAIEFARRGYIAAGADNSAGMIAHARKNTAEAGVQVELKQAGFGEIANAFGNSAFDAIICLGNSLPHILSMPDLRSSLQDFAASLKPGGGLIIQNRNFDAVMASKERFMEPQTYRRGDQEEIFVRFYDFLPNGLINFHMLTLERQSEGWKQRVTTSQLYPLLKDELHAALQGAGFINIRFYGSLGGADFHTQSSPNTVVVAYLPG